MKGKDKNANDRGYKKEANDSQETPSTVDKTQPLPPPCYSDLEETPSPIPRKDVRWYGITSRCYPYPFPSTAKTTPVLAGTGTVLHRRKYETEKYANMSYESNLIIRKSHVQGWEYFILVSKLQ